MWSPEEDKILLENFVGSTEAKLRELLPNRNTNEINARVAWLLRNAYEFSSN